MPRALLSKLLDVFNIFSNKFIGVTNWQNFITQFSFKIILNSIYQIQNLDGFCKKQRQVYQNLLNVTPKIRLELF